MEVADTLRSIQLLDMRKALLLHFSEPEMGISLMEKILVANFTIPSLYSYLNEYLNLVCNKTKVNSAYTVEQAESEIEHRLKIEENVYIDKCPEHIRSVLCAHKPASLEYA